MGIMIMIANKPMIAFNHFLGKGGLGIAVLEMEVLG